ncbi:MAG: zinc dependent phospholipase C family protein [Acidobacteriaceae bacterium]|nr:zinc dependent phospholipase C family protein [Acidobacteriaceae bacterium]
MRASMGAMSAAWILLFGAHVACGYSVLSHEALVDALWDVAIKPTLMERFPSATPEQLKEAHGYAYGGAIIQDMGFYPQGNGYFSDLTHYARPGDFIRALLRDAQTLDDLAFALGALSHFAGDCYGHRYGTNIAEPRVYPKLKKKYGTSITYAQNPNKHLKTEFGFDVLEVARGNYASQAYHDFIGFYVARPLLERAFRETYGFELADMFGDLPRAIESYRRTVSNLVPLATRVAWAQHKDDIEKLRPGITRRRFVYVMRRPCNDAQNGRGVSRAAQRVSDSMSCIAARIRALYANSEREWGRNYERPSVWDRILAFLLRVLPPIGPLNTLHFKVLTPPAQQDFMRSFELATELYRNQLRAASRQDVNLPNDNFDVGAITPPATYTLQDLAYAYWLDQLAEQKFAGVTPEVRDAVISYYANIDLPFSSKKQKKTWRRLLVEVDQLKRSAPASAVATNDRVRQTNQAASGR